MYMLCIYVLLQNFDKESSIILQVTVTNLYLLTCHTSVLDPKPKFLGFQMLDLATCSYILDKEA
jgi:hypothetical protein